MAVTNYETVNGQIVAEYTAGVATEYVHDALGSVIATTDSTRTVQNTYRWAGYGTQIAKTGTASDPKFLWNGMSGYRATGRAHATHYVRARTYAAQEAAWLAVDSRWPTEDAYRYCRARPTGLNDPSGRDPLIVRTCDKDRTKKLGNPCNDSMDIWWSFKIDSQFTGWIVQRVVHEGYVYCCAPPKGNATGPLAADNCAQNYPIVVGWPPHLIGYIEIYFEAWWVEGGIMENPPNTQYPYWHGVGTDRWNFGQQPCTFGEMNITGDFVAIPATSNSTPPGSLQYAAIKCAGGLPSGTSFTGDFSLAHASSHYDWNCCGGPSPDSTYSCCKSKDPTCRKPHLAEDPSC